MRISDGSSDVCSADLRTFLELGKRFPRGNIVSLGLIGFFVLLGIASLWLPYRIATPLAARVVLVGVLWIAVAGIVVVRRGYVPARLFMLRSEEHTSALQSLMRISYGVVCLNKTTTKANP